MSNLLSAYYKFTHKPLLTERHHTRTIKEEPGSPAKSTSKRKLFSTTGSNPIGNIELFDEADILQGSSKQQKSGAGRAPHVRFEGAAGTSNTRPAPKPIRRSTRNPKANAKNEDDSKPGVDELFVKLGQEFQAIAKTCETIAETINFYA